MEQKNRILKGPRALRAEIPAFSLGEMSSAATLNGFEDGPDAIQLKELGNQDFKNGNYQKAIEHYTRAIGTSLKYTCLRLTESDTVDKRTLAICLTNRAQCHIRLEEFGTPP